MAGGRARRQTGIRRRIAAIALRGTLVGAAVLVVLVVVVVAPLWLLSRQGSASAGLGQFGVLLPFIAVTICVAGRRFVTGPVDALVERVTQHRATTPYSALAEAASRLRTGTPDAALPGLAEVLAEGTGARRAVVWLAVSDRLVPAAVYPPPEPEADTVDVVPQPVVNLAMLLDEPDTDFVVPVLEGTTLRAALAIAKPGAPITPADQALMHDLASGAGMLLRGVALNTELRDRVQRADELAAELDRSRRRLATARDVERRRLVGELSHATTDRLSTLRLVLDGARQDLLGEPPEPSRAGIALVRARTLLDELLDRFRVIARGVYPAVLRDQGPVGALDEVATDLERPVRLTGGLDERLSWEVESGIYYVAASAIQWLAEHPGPALELTLEHSAGRLTVRIVDPEPAVNAADLRTALAGDLERLAALGGEAALGLDDRGRLVLEAGLPDRLEPLVGSGGVERGVA